MEILHLIHTTAFGGVESAAAHLRRVLADDVSAGYRIGALEKAPDGAEIVQADVVGSGVNSPRAALHLVREVRRSRPQVLVTSLWRTVAIGQVARLICPDVRWAVWVHLSAYTHVLDRLVHRWCLPRADMIFCDSDASYDALVRPALAGRRRQVPVRIVRPAAAALPVAAPSGASVAAPSTAPALEQPAPSAHPAHAAPPAPEEPLRMVFWGRLATQKRLDLAIELTGLLRRLWPGGAELLLIGPDDGEKQNLMGQAHAAGLDDHVHFAAPMGREDLARAAAKSHVFIQLSDMEGFAMSAHEALAASMVCVLTPVGDLAADTTDGVDSLHHHGDLRVTAERLVGLARDPDGFGRMAAAAGQQGYGGFVEAFVDACRETSEAPR